MEMEITENPVPRREPRLAQAPAENAEPIAARKPMVLCLPAYPPTEGMERFLSAARAANVYRNDHVRMELVRRPLADFVRVSLDPEYEAARVACLTLEGELETAREVLKRERAARAASALREAKPAPGGAGRTPRAAKAAGKAGTGKAGDDPAHKTAVAELSARLKEARAVESAHKGRTRPGAIRVLDPERLVVRHQKSLEGLTKGVRWVKTGTATLFLGDGPGPRRAAGSWGFRVQGEEGAVREVCVTFAPLDPAAPLPTQRTGTVTEGFAEADVRCVLSCTSEDFAAWQADPARGLELYLAGRLRLVGEGVDWRAPGAAHLAALWDLAAGWWAAERVEWPRAEPASPADLDKARQILAADPVKFYGGPKAEVSNEVTDRFKRAKAAAVSLLRAAAVKAGATYHIYQRVDEATEGFEGGKEVPRFVRWKDATTQEISVHPANGTGELRTEDVFTNPLAQVHLRRLTRGAWRALRGAEEEDPALPAPARPTYALAEILCGAGGRAAPRVKVPVRVCRPIPPGFVLWAYLRRTRRGTHSWDWELQLVLRPDALRLCLATVTPALLHDPACGHILPAARLSQVLRVTCTLDNGGPRPQTFTLRATHAPQHPVETGAVRRDIEGLDFRFSEDTVTVPPGGTRIVLLTVTYPPDLAPGAHEWCVVASCQAACGGAIDVRQLQRVCIQAEAPAAGPPLLMAVHYAWRPTPRGIRAAYVVGMDGRAYEVLLPRPPEHTAAVRTWRERLQAGDPAVPTMMLEADRAADLRSIRSQRMDLFKEVLGRFLATLPERPLWLQRLTTGRDGRCTVARWGSPQRIAEFADALRAAREAGAPLPGEDAPQPWLEGWAMEHNATPKRVMVYGEAVPTLRCYAQVAVRHDWHLDQMAVGTATRPLRRRLDWYRRIAAHGSRHYLGVVLPRRGTVAKAFTEAPRPEEGTESEGSALRKLQRLAAPSELHLALKNAFERDHGDGAVVETDPAYTTRRHHGCGFVNEESAEITILCAGCGVRYDVDDNAARNELAQAIEVRAKAKGRWADEARGALKRWFEAQAQ